MLAAWIMEIILALAPQYNVPPYLIAAIIIVENEGNQYRINNSSDRVSMQLISSRITDENRQYTETMIKDGIQHLALLYNETRKTSPNWFAAVIAFNCGLKRYNASEPLLYTDINYAHTVFNLWTEICPERQRLYGER
ncbi:MAG: lytic transglycosylase domain-containing protein [Treponema sp.]|nr:lytic transglycosylase domain-containing protein [Treponema sp.]